jgi:hypothetical protein
MALRPKVQSLTVEQQHVLAEVELARLRRRERRLRHARTYLGRRWLSLVAFAFAVWVVAVHVPFPYTVVAISILAAAFALVQVHVAGINRRLDALMELLDTERRDAVEQKSASDDKTT